MPQNFRTGTRLPTGHRHFSGTDTSLPSRVAKVTAQNDVPVGNDDTLPAGVLSGNVFTNDVDNDGVFNSSVLDTSKWTAILVSGTSSGTLVLNGNGSFTYTPAGCGVVTFRYKVKPGTFAYQVNGASSVVPMSADSNTATVTMTPLCLFVGVQNVPPPAGKTTKPGSAIPMQWRSETERRP